jgi:V8-like Glu-specific endopeptidase
MSRSRLVTMLVMAVAVLATATFLAMPTRAGNGRPTELPSVVSTSGPTMSELMQQQADLNRRLMGELPSAALDSAIRIHVPPDEIDAVDNASRFATPQKIGILKPMTPAVEISGLTQGASSRDPHQGPSAPATPTTDGGFVWAVAVQSDDAGAMRLHVERMSLPPNAEMFFYSRTGEAFGPYKGSGPNDSGEFWTTAVFGTEGILQVRLSPPVSNEDLRAVAFAVSEVGIITKRFASTFAPLAPPPPGICGNATCIVDANCYTAANGLKDAIAKIEWIQGAYIYTCTGGLLNETNPSQDNFFLTANHCISKNNNAQNADFYWRFRTDTCNGTCPDNAGWPYKTTGSTVSKSGRKGDFTLLHLNSAPPSGSTFLGWTCSAVANTNGTFLHRVSNPNFGTQVYSEHSVDTSAPTCSGWPRGERIYSRDTLGGIDGGSSGSPVANGSNQVVGQLSGTCGTSPSSTCNSGPGGANATVDGAFAYYCSLVQPILAP